MAPSSSVVLHDVSFAWPDGTPALDRVSGAFGRGRTGLVGVNGAGKSTLLRLVAGRLTPTGGSLTVTGGVDHLPQQLTAAPDATLADLLGVRAPRDALRAVEAGSVDPAHFETIGSDWDVEERATAELGALGLPTELDRPVTALSGGEAVLAALAGVVLRRADVVSLHTPLTAGTHHLVGRPELALMKPTAVLVNTSRGGVVDTDALVSALGEGRLRAAGIDVHEEEPVPLGHPLTRLENVVLTPHLAWYTEESYTELKRRTVENAVEAVFGRAPRNVVTEEAR